MKRTLYAVPAMLCLTAAIVTAQDQLVTNPRPKTGGSTTRHAFNTTGPRGVGGHEQDHLHRLREAWNGSRQLDS